MTLRASRAQPPLVRRRPERRDRRRTGSASTRGPSTASSAGSRVSAATIATSTAAIPPKPIERRKTCGKISSPASAIATVSPETATVRPAVAIVRTTASSVLSPRPQLLPEAADHEQAVVDRQPEPEDGDHVDREHRHVGDQGEQPQRGERAEDRGDADGQRQPGRDHAAEDEHEQHQQHRHGQHLGPGDVRADPLLDVAADRDPAADLRVQPGCGERVLDRRQPVGALLLVRAAQHQHRVRGVPVGADQRRRRGVVPAGGPLDDRSTAARPGCW